MSMKTVVSALLLMLSVDTAYSKGAISKYSPNALQVLQHLQGMSGLSGLSGRSPNSVPSITVGKKKRKDDSPIYYIKLPPSPHYYSSNLLPSLQRIEEPSPPSFHKPKVDFKNNGRPQTIYHIPSSPSFSLPYPRNPAQHDSYNRPSAFNFFQRPSSSYSSFGSSSNYFGSSYVKPKTTTTTTTTTTTPRPLYQLPIYNPVQDIYNDPYANNIPSSIYSSPSFNNDITSFSKTDISLPPELPLSPHITGPSYLKKPTRGSKPVIALKKSFLYNGRPSNIYVWKPNRRTQKSKYRHRYFKDFNY